MYLYLFKIIITLQHLLHALKNVMLVLYKCCVSFILVLGLQLCWYWTCDYQQLWLNMSRWHTDGSCHHETLLRRLQALQNIDQYESQNWLQDGWYFVDIATLFYLIFSSFVLVSYILCTLYCRGDSEESQKGLCKETRHLNNLINCILCNRISNVIKVPLLVFCSWWYVISGYSNM